MESVDYSQYVSKLQGNAATSVTQNWDVAVTYEATRINALLASEHNKKGTLLPTKVTRRFRADSPWGEYTQHYEFEFGPPLIQFQAVGIPTCSLKMLLKSFKGWGVNDAGQKSKVTDYGTDAFYCVLSNVSLGLVSGTTQSAGQPKDTIKFDNSSLSEHIIVSFPTKSSVVDIEPTPNNKSPSRIENLGKLRQSLGDYFPSVPKIAYTLAIINNLAPESDKFKVLDLIPDSFRIVCAANDKRSFLTLLVRTKAADSDTVGNTKNLQELWSGQWANIGTDPVPQGETASIIINKSFFVNQFLLRAAKKGAVAGGCTDARVVPLNNESGFKIEFDWKTTWKSGKSESSSLQSGTSHHGESIDVHDRTIDPNQGGEKLNMKFGQANGTDKPATIAINWSYKDYIPWNDHYHDAGSEGAYNRNRRGVVIATQTLKKTVDVTDDLSDESFSVKFGIAANDWVLKTEAKGTNAGDKILSVFGPLIGLEYNSEHVPKLAKILAQTYMEFDFNFGALRFFLTTNILLPGRKVVDVNLKDGLRIPNDVVIVGKVVKEAKEVAIRK